jgi:glyoxylase-like metal-dependent hydrolase (beta-lactamase superfamily II)
MIKVEVFQFNDFAENTYVLSDDTKECVIIDPGCYSQAERDVLTSYINQNGLKPVKLLNTHCHIDHILGNEFVSSHYQLPINLHKEELFTYNETKRWTIMFNMSDIIIPENLVYVNEGDKITFGNSTLDVLFTPGHSIASISFYCKEEAFVISGDVLFMQSIGRTDLPGGNIETLLQSIRTKLFTLPENTKVYSGHGPSTSIADEKANNPYLKN